MPPGLLTEVKMEGLHRLLCSLLRGEAGPLVPACPFGHLGHLQVLFRLEKPVPGPVHPLSLQQWGV